MWKYKLIDVHWYITRMISKCLFLRQRCFCTRERVNCQKKSRGELRSDILKKRAKYLLECKNKLWRRWKKEYLVALRERHNMTHKTSKFQPKAGDVVLLKSENKNRGVWSLGVVEETYPGKDTLSLPFVRAVRVKTSTGSLEI